LENPLASNDAGQIATVSDEKDFEEQRKGFYSDGRFDETGGRDKAPGRRLTPVLSIWPPVAG
jgi:hypothetical protein